jgi:hypothetical protein
MNYKEKIINDLIKEIDQNLKQFQQIEPNITENRKIIENDFTKKEASNNKNSNLVYTKSHFKWLFKQGSKHSLFRYFDQDDKTELEKLLDDLCKSFNLDINELYKLFLVNNEKGSSTYLPIKLELIDNKEAINEYCKEIPRHSVDQFRNNRKISSLISKNDIKDSEKHVKEKFCFNPLNYSGFKAFYDYYKLKRNGKTPYSFKFIN